MLQQVEIFQGLSPEELEVLSNSSTSRSFPKNTVVIHENDPADSLFVIESGKVKVYCSDKNGKEFIRMRPEKRVYNAGGMPMTEAAIYSNLRNDLYVSLGEPLERGAWSVRIYLKPFVTWIWTGCGVMALGGMLSLTDRRYRVAMGKKIRTKLGVSGSHRAAGGAAVPEEVEG